MSSFQQQEKIHKTSGEIGKYRLLKGNMSVKAVPQEDLMTDPLVEDLRVKVGQRARERCGESLKIWNENKKFWSQVV